MALHSGCRAILTLVTVETCEEEGKSVKPHHELLIEFLKALLENYGSQVSGLCNCFLAVLEDATLKKSHQQVGQSFGKWHCVPTQSIGSERDGFAGNSTALSILEDIASVVTLVKGIPQKNDCQSSYGVNMANKIHALLDKVPWRPHELVVFDVYWLISGHTICSPSSAMELYSALLRLKEWHDAHIKLVCYSAKSAQLQEWQEALDAPVLGGLSSLDASSGIIWRGAVHFTELKAPKQTQHQVTVFPGFSLSLDLEREADSLCTATCLEAVGLKMVRFSHLEILQIVDMSTLPVFWRSPVQCVLSLSNPLYSDSVVLFKSLLSCQCTGLLMRLCIAERDGQQLQHRTTSNWIAHLQSLEQNSYATVPPPSVLASYLPGPILLVQPTTDGGSPWSCPSWFLWKHESLNPVLFTQLPQTMPVATEDEVDPHEWEEPAVMNFSEDYGNCDLESGMFSYSRRDFGQQLSRTTHVLDLPPCEWPEIGALQTHEWIQRKLIRRLATPDLMFGQMVAPPPTGVKESIDVNDVLSCFTESGSPTVSDLSPIAMNDPSHQVKMHDPGTGNISYESILASTPSSKKSYHGVSYCLTSGDISMDARLTKIQQRYVVSEKASTCSTSIMPKAERYHRRKQSCSHHQEIHEDIASSVRVAPKAISRNTMPQGTVANIKLSKSPVVKVTKVKHVAKSDRKQPEQSAVSRSEKCVSFVAAVPQTSPASIELTVNKASKSHAVKSSDVLPCTLMQESLPSISSNHPIIVQQPSLEHHLDTQEVLGVEKPESSEECQLGSGEGNRIKKEKRSHRHKRRLGEAVVAALKKNHVPRCHPCFRKCYGRLFTISKSFLKDLSNSRELTEEMKRVVESNVSQVIDFELRRANLARKPVPTMEQ